MDRSTFRAAILVFLGAGATMPAQGAELLGYTFSDSLGETIQASASSQFLALAGEVRLDLASGIDRRVAFELQSAGGEVLQTAESGLIGPQDRIEDAEGNSYYGASLQLDPPGEGAYELVTRTLNAAGEVVREERYAFTVDLTPPQITETPTQNQYQRYRGQQWNPVTPRDGGPMLSAPISYSGAEPVRAEVTMVSRKTGEIGTAEVNVTGNEVLGQLPRQAFPHPRDWHDMTLKVYDEAGNVGTYDWEAKAVLEAQDYEVAGVYDPDAPASERPWSHIPALSDYVAYEPGVRIHHADTHLLLRIRKEDHLDHNPFGLGYPGHTGNDRFGLRSGSNSNIHEMGGYVYGITSNRVLTSHEPVTRQVQATNLGGDNQAVNRQSIQLGLVDGARPGLGVPQVNEVIYADGSTSGRVAHLGANDEWVITGLRGSLPQAYPDPVEIVFREGDNAIVPAGETEWEVSGASSQATYPRVHACYASGDRLCGGTRHGSVHRDDTFPELRDWSYRGVNEAGEHEYRFDVWSRYVETRPIRLDSAELQVTHLDSGDVHTFEPVHWERAASDYDLRFRFAGLPTGEYSIELRLEDTTANVTQETIEQRFIDAEIPQVSINFEGGSGGEQSPVIRSLDDIQVTVTDSSDPEPGLTRIRLSGGPADDVVNLSWRAQGEGVFGLEYPVMFPSLDEGDYLIEVWAEDWQRNEGFGGAQFTYSPPLAELIGVEEGRVALPAINKALQREDGTEVVETAPLEMADGSIVEGTYDVFATLRSDAEVAVRVNGVVVEPGATMEVLPAHDFSAAGGRMSLPVSAATPGEAGVAPLLVTTAAPNSPVAQLDVNFWMPEARLSSAQWEYYPAIDPINVELALGVSAPCATTLEPASAAADGNAITDPICLVEWINKPSETYGQEEEDGTVRITGVATELGIKRVGYTVSVFDHNGGRHVLETGEEELYIKDPHDSITLAVRPEKDQIKRIVEEDRYTLERVAGLGCTLTTSEERAENEAMRGRAACLVEWTEIPPGLSVPVWSTDPRLDGYVESEDADAARFAWHIAAYTPMGSRVEMGPGEQEIPLADPPAPEIEIDERNLLTESLYAAPITGGLIGDMSITGYPTDLEVWVFSGEEQVDHGYYNAGHSSSLTARRRVFAEQGELWGVEALSMRAAYADLPWVDVEKEIQVVTVPDEGVRPELSVAETTVLDVDEFQVDVAMKDPFQREVGYDPGTMGQWEVRLTNHVSFSRQEPLTEFKAMDPEQGTASFSMLLEDFESSSLRLSAEARLISPVPEYERTVTAARPIFMTVLRGGEIDADLAGRRLEGEAPLNVLVSLELESRLDWAALGEIEWQVREEGGEWAPYEGDLRIENRFQGTFDAGVYELRARMVNQFSEAESFAGPIEIHAYDIPRLEIEGPWNVFIGDTGHYTLAAELNQEEIAKDLLEIQWSEDRGETWVDGGLEYAVTREERDRVFLSARARLKSAPGDNQEAWQVVNERITFQPVRPPRAGIYGPRLIEVGEPEQWRAAVREPYRHMDVEIRGEFIMPDGSTVADLDEVSYAATTQDQLDERIEIGYRAWIEGFDEEGAVAEVSRRIRVWEYTWPDWTFYVRKSAHYAPAEVSLRMRTPGGTTRYLEDLTYEWIVPPGAEVTEERWRDGRGLYFDEPGEYPVSVRIQDGRGNDSTVTYRVKLAEPPPWNVNFSLSKSNDYMRAPLGVRFRPDVGGGHPRDRVQEHRYLLNGEVVVEGQRYGYIELPVGNHTVGLEVETEFGHVRRYEQPIEVVPNQPPVCSGLDARESSSGWRFYARCNDPDGRVVAHRWIVDGEEIGISGSRISVSKRESDRPQIRVIAVDDSGDESEPLDW